MKCWGGYIKGGGDVEDGKSVWVDLVIAPIGISIAFYYWMVFKAKIFLFKSDK